MPSPTTPRTRSGPKRDRDPRTPAALRSHESERFSATAKKEPRAVGPRLPCFTYGGGAEKSASSLRESARLRPPDGDLARSLKTLPRFLYARAPHGVRFSATAQNREPRAAGPRLPCFTYGGGAENRTPVQSKPLKGVSRLSCRLGLSRRAPGNPRLATQLVQSFRLAYQLRPSEHLPKMTSPRERERSPL